MTLQIPLSPETEAKLLERAASEGKDPATFVVEAIQQKLDGSNGSGTRPTLEDRTAAWDRFVTHMRQWTQNLPPGHRIDDSRETIYEGRGE